MNPQNLNIFVAAAAGVVSFVSPCVLPLVPSYLSFIGGQGLADMREGRERGRLLLRTLAFVLGFSLVFVLMGIVFSGTALAFSGALRWINIAAGAVVVLFGLNLMFGFLKFLNYEKRVHVERKPAGVPGSFLLGMAFAAGWSPCIGPILASILALAAGSGSLGTAGVLLGAYSLGLALPFLLTSLFISQAEGIMKRIKPHMPVIQKVSGAVLLLIGVLMIFGQYQQITNWLLGAGFRLESWYGSNRLAGRIAFSAASVSLGLVIGWLGIRKKGSLRRLHPLTAILVLGLFAAGILQALGMLDIPLILAGWLRFQGI